MESDTLTFLKELPKSFRQIGAVIPSSRALAKALARPVRLAKEPIRILEVGPGTGPITRQILRFMGSEDTLLICELNATFLQRLQSKLEKNPFFQRHRDRVNFFQGPVQNLVDRGLENSFDAIVSSLPFSNFAPDVVEEILNLFSALLAPNGTFTFCEYVGLRKLSAIVRPAHERARAKAVDAVVDRWMESWEIAGQVKKDFTLLNVPPAITVEVRNRAPEPRRVRA
jgi:phosphatidylethanolamine/phosphatidyl-N-methylethanolamine N-methyltransferase